MSWRKSSRRHQHRTRGCLQRRSRSTQCTRRKPPLFHCTSRKSPTHCMRQQQLWRTSTHDEAAARDRLSRSQYMDQTLKQTYSQEYPESAACVQDPIDSLNSAIRNAHRTSLRPSSTFEPRHPSLKGVIGISNERAERPSSRKPEKTKSVRKKCVCGGSG